MADISMLQSLMGVNNGVATPAQGIPMQQGMNPVSALNSLQPGTVPPTTPMPDLTANLNPGVPARSLEELLFGG